MAFYLCGINHNSADLALRERLSITQEKLAASLAVLIQQTDIEEAVILSTCNRCEIYCVAEHAHTLRQWLAQHHGMAEEDLFPFLYFFEGETALHHLAAVTCGLDSMMLGESEIFGQVKEAFALATQMGAVGSHLHHLFQQVFAITKKVRSETGIGDQPVSVAYTAVNLAKYIFADLSALRVLLIGAGQTISLAVEHLMKRGVAAHNIVVANRTLEKAQELAASFSAEAITLEQVPAYLKQCDMVLTATASPEPIITASMVSAALKGGQRHPLLMIDLAMPRDIESTTGKLDGVYLYNIDDLKKITDEGLAKRQDAAKVAQRMIVEEVKHYLHRFNAPDFAEIVCHYRQQVSLLREQELEKALQALAQGQPADVVLRTMARSLTNKLMHVPSAQLRQAGYHGRHEFLNVAKQLLGLDGNKPSNKDEVY